MTEETQPVRQRWVRRAVVLALIVPALIGLRGETNDDRACSEKPHPPWPLCLAQQAVYHSAD